MTDHDHIAALKAAADPQWVAASLGLRGRGKRFFCPLCQPNGGKTPDLFIEEKGFFCHIEARKRQGVTGGGISIRERRGTSPTSAHGHCAPCCFAGLAPLSVTMWPRVQDLTGWITSRGIPSV